MVMIVTDFIATGGPDNYAWNLIRSEADEILFRHAGKSGAKIFDSVRVNSVDFEPSNSTANGSSHLTLPNPGRPISASYTKNSDGSIGVIKFDYIVDATGRTGLLSTKYLKNRHYTKVLKNIANWAYFKGTGSYAEGTARANTPLFEALQSMLTTFVISSNIRLISDFYRSTWLGLVYSSPQWYHVCRGSNEPGRGNNNQERNSRIPSRIL